MEILTDAERKSEQRRTALAIVVGIATVICGGIIVANDTSSWFNWLSGLAVIGAGAVLEEKFILRRRK